VASSVTTITLNFDVVDFMFLNVPVGIPGGQPLMGACTAMMPVFGFCDVGLMLSQKLMEWLSNILCSPPG
jgi:hypothetical protein